MIFTSQNTIHHGLKWAVVSFIFIQNLIAQDRPYLPIYSGMEISGDVLFIPGKYVVIPEEWSPIIVQGKNIDLNFNDAYLVGNQDNISPTFYSNTGIICKDAENVTIRNLRISRFMTAIRFENCKNIRLENCEISYMSRQPWIQDLSFDSSFDLEKLINGGAAVQIEDCQGVQIRDNYFNANHIGLKISRSSDMVLNNNFFLFHSGTALKVEACQQTHIAHNRFDFNFSHPLLSKISGTIYTPSLKLKNCSRFTSIEQNGFSKGLAAISAESCLDTLVISKNNISQMLKHGLQFSGSKFFCFDNRIEKCESAAIFHKIDHIEATNNLIADVSLAFEFKYTHNSAIVAINHNALKHCDTFFKITDKQNKNFSVEWYQNLIESDFISHKPLPHRFFNSCYDNIWFVTQKSTDYLKYKRIFCRKNKCFTDLSPDLNACNDFLTEKQYKMPWSPFSAIPGAMSTAIGMYDHMPMENMKAADFGPYDYRYPATFSFFDKNNQVKLQILGPLGALYSIQNLSDSTDKQKGSLPDEFSIENFYAHSINSWKLSIHGENMKWPDGSITGPLDTLNLLYSNIPNTSSYHLSCILQSSTHTQIHLDTNLTALRKIPWDRIKPIEGQNVKCNLKIQPDNRVIPMSIILQSSMPIISENSIEFSNEKFEYSTGVWTKKVSLNEKTSILPLKFSFEPKSDGNYLGILWLNTQK